MKNTIAIDDNQLTRWDLLLLVCICFVSPLAQAEVTLDGSVGPAGALPGPDYKITENLGKRAGSNLFHSFGRFNLNVSESATFSGTAGIKNVISRVTSGQTSNIDGTLRVSIPNANLYLLNPAGVIFGEHAKLDVPGSFHVSTADYLKFQGGIHFDTGVATTPQVLTTAEPEAFGFLDNNPASISLSGNTGSTLEVQRGSTLSIIGGDITSRNTAIYAPGGQINIASVGSAGEVSFNESSIQTTSFGQMGDIHINQNPLVPRTVLAEGVKLANIDASDDAAGKIFIRGGQLVMENSLIASDTSNGNGGGINIRLTDNLNISSPEKTLGGLATDNEITSVSYGSGDAGSIAITSDALEVRGAAIIDSSNFSQGDGGDLTINVNNLKLLDGGRILNEVETEATGKGGNLKIAAKNISLSGEDTFISTEVFGHGDGGNLVISTDSLDVRDEAIIVNSTFSEGGRGDITINANNLKLLDGGRILNEVRTEASSKGGNLKIEANNISLSGEDTFISTEVFGHGDGSNLVITTDTLDVRDEARITSSTFSKGDGGNLVITADTLDVRDEAIIVNSTFSEGDRGDITINANNLKLLDGGRILNEVRAETSSKGGNLKIAANNISLSGEDTFISTEVFGHGDGSNLVITTDTLDVRDEARITSSTFSKGDGGNLVIIADILDVRDKAVIVNTTFSEGDGGDLTINANNLKLLDGGRILDEVVGAEASGKGGNLKIATNNISLSGKGTFISTEVFGKGDGGNLVITTDTLDVRDEAIITGSTFSKGDGGNLIITADTLDVRNDAVIVNTTFSEGDRGDLTINANNLKLLDGGQILNEVRAETSSKGGNLKIEAKNISLSGGEDTFISTKVFGHGDGGNLVITTDTLDVRDEARITSSTFSKGDGGDLKIKADNIVLTGKRTGVFSEAQPSEIEGNSSGTAGDIAITVSDMDVRDGASISTADFDISSNANIDKSGKIAISLKGILRLENNSIIKTLTKKANAGDIAINNGNILWLRDSSIVTSVQNDKGNGGNIFISTPIVALDSSSIIAQAKKGQGGNITITGFLFQSPSSEVSASSELGIDGNIDLKPDTNISGSLAVLPDTFLNASQQVSERCVARSGNNLSSFMVKGRGGVPLSPGNLAPSTFMDYLQTEESSSQGSMNYYSPDNNRSLSYSGSGKSLQFASRSIDCNP